MLSSLLKLFGGGHRSIGTYARVLPDGDQDGSELHKETEASLWAVEEKKKPKASNDIAEELFLFTLDLQVHSTWGSSIDGTYGNRGLVWYSSKIEPPIARQLSLLLWETLPVFLPDQQPNPPRDRAPLDSNILNSMAQLANLVSSCFPRITTSAFGTVTKQSSNFVLSLDSSLAVLSLSFVALQLNFPSEPLPLLLPVIELLLGALQAVGLSLPYDATVDARLHYASCVQVAIAFILGALQAKCPAVCSLHDVSILLKNLSPALTLIAHHGCPDEVYQIVCKKHWQVCNATLVELETFLSRGLNQVSIGDIPDAPVFIATYSRIRSALALSSPLPRDFSSEVSACMSMGTISVRMRFLLNGLRFVLAAGFAAPPLSSARPGQGLAVVGKHDWLRALQDSMMLMLGGSAREELMNYVVVSLAPTILEILLHFLLSTETVMAEEENVAKTMGSILATFTQQLMQRRACNKNQVPSPFRPLSSNPSNPVVDRFLSQHGSFNGGVGLVRLGSGRSTASVDSAPETYSTAGSIGAVYPITDIVVDGRGLSSRLVDSVGSLGTLDKLSPGGISGSAMGTPARISVTFSVGDKVDGLYMTNNGSKRWFPAVCTGYNPEAQTCSISYDDGDMASDKPVSEVRQRKYRGSRGLSNNTTSGSPATVGTVAQVLVSTTSSSSAATVTETEPPSMTPTLKPSRTPRKTPPTNLSSLYISPPSVAAVARPAPALKPDRGDDSDNDSEDNVFEIPSVLAIDGVGQSSSTSAQFSNNTSYAKLGVSRLQLHDLPLDQSGSGIFGAGSLSSGIIMDTSVDAAEMMHALSLHSSRLHSASSLSRPPTGAYTGRHTERRGFASFGGGGDVLMSASEQKPVRSARSGLGTPLTASMSDSTSRILTWREGNDVNFAAYQNTGRTSARLASKQGIRSHVSSSIASQPASLNAPNPDSLYLHTLVASVCIVYSCIVRESDGSRLNEVMVPGTITCSILTAVESFLTEASLLGSQDNVTNSLYLLASTLVGPSGRRLVTLLGVPPMPSVPQLVKMADSGVRLGHGAFGSVTRVDVEEDSNNRLPVDIKANSHFNMNTTATTHTREVKSYAIKRVSRFRTGGATTAFDAVLNEIAVWEHLIQKNAPGIVSLISYGVVREEYWLVMTLGGDSLANWRAQLSPILTSRKLRQSTPSALRYWLALLLELYLDCCLVVRGVHAGDVLHFDVKSENFLMSRQMQVRLEKISAAAEGGRGEEFISCISQVLGDIRRCHANDCHAGIALLTDFGESVIYPRPVAADPGLSELRLRTCKGTLHIQAPEMLVLNGNNPTSTSPGCSADVWSLGCLCVEILTGRQLFAGMSWTELYAVLCSADANTGNARNHAGHGFEPVAQVRSLAAMLQTVWVGPLWANWADGDELNDIQNLVKQMLALRPSERPTTEQVCIQLENMLQGVGEGIAARGSRTVGAAGENLNIVARADAMQGESFQGLASYPEGKVRTQDCVALPVGAVLDFCRSMPFFTFQPKKSITCCSIILMALRGYNSSLVASLSERGYSESSNTADGLGSVLLSLGTRCVTAGAFAEGQCIVQLDPVEFSVGVADGIETSTDVSCYNSQFEGSLSQCFKLPIPVQVGDEMVIEQHLEGAETEALRSLGKALKQLKTALTHVQSSGSINGVRSNGGLTIFLAPLDRTLAKPASNAESTAPPSVESDGSFFSLVSIYTAILLQLWWSGADENDVDCLRGIQWIGILPPQGATQLWRLKSFLDKA